MKKSNKPTMIFLAMSLLGGSSLAEETINTSAHTDSLVTYSHPAQEEQNRRREAGVSPEGSSSEVRGANRGSQRGSVRGANRGNQRGVSRAASRGANRGVSRAATDVLLPLPKRMEPLAPKGTAYTTAVQPVLYFYLSDPSSMPIRFTFNREDQVEPLILEELPLDSDTGVIEAGIHAIELAHYGVQLETGVEYEWFVSIVLDEQERSSDFLASATLKYIQPEAELQEALVAEPQSQHYAVYAREGYWYDAIAALNQALEAEPSNASLNRQRAAWLQDLELPATLAYVEQAMKIN